MARPAVEFVYLLALIFCSEHSICAQHIQGAGFDPEPVQLGANAPGIPRPVTSYDLLSLRDPQGMSISPDGKHIAFVVGQAIGETNSYRSGLFVVATQGDQDVRSFGSAGPPHWDDINQWIPEAPQWSHDSNLISYRMRVAAGEHWQVWGWDTGTGQREQITHVNGDVESYRWLGDGRALLLEVLLSPREQETARWAEHGILLDGEISPYRSIPVLAQMAELQVSERTYWVHECGTGIERRATEKEIRDWDPLASFDAIGSIAGKQAPLSEKYKIVDANPSPDGKKVAYLYVVDDPAVSPRWARRLLIRSKSGGEFMEVTPDSYYIDQCWWSPNGTTLYFTERTGLGRSPRLYAVSGSDVRPKLIFKTDRPEYLSSFSSDRRGRYFVCLWESSNSPAQVALLDSATNQVKKIVDLNPEFGSLRQSPAERMEGTNRFGENWFAYLVKPLDYVNGRKYPLVVTTYRSGDYFLRGASGDENPIQVYAAKGFAVLCFDVGFLRNTRPGDFQDKLIDWSSPVASIEVAIKRLVDGGLVDPRRIGIAGFSHGEEIGGYAVTHTYLFRAASGAQTYDPCFYALGGEAWHQLFTKWGLDGWTEGNTKPYWREIALSANADKVGTAILQNVSDTEYVGDMSAYRALKDLGKPIEFYIYPNVLHVRNQPKHKLEIYERNVDWFLFWLKDEEDSDPAKAGQFARWRKMRDAEDKARKASH
jgi:dipeptidyl aminopeptidase/acylaminoacyl peptidase